MDPEKLKCRGTYMVKDLGKKRRKTTKKGAIKWDQKRAFYPKTR